MPTLTWVRAIVFPLWMASFAVGCASDDSSPLPDSGGTGGTVSTGGTSATGGTAQGGTGAGTGATMSEYSLKLPVQRGAVYTYELGPVTMTVDPAQGARIAQFALNGVGLLTGSDVNTTNWGATFWTSPQTTWAWPPVEAIDSKPYTGSVDASNVLSLTSGVGTLGASGVKLTVTKRFTPLPDKGAIDVTYTMTNAGTVPATVAPWQIARVAAGGLTFFRLGSGGITSDKLAMQTLDGVAWYKYDAAIITGENFKAFADGMGWLAHVSGELLFLQVFPDVPVGAAAPAEAEIELYANPAHTYVELEPQGAIETVAPGASSKPWTVRWLVRKLPAGVTAEPGNAQLVAFVEQLIQQ